jgi:hypothetical protein
VDWQRHPHNLTRQVPEGWLVLAPAAEAPVLLSGSAAALWELLAVPTSTDGLVAAIIDRFQGDPDEIRRDLHHALAELVDRGVIESASP